MPSLVMPQLGEIIPDNAIDFFPEGNYGAALLADDGSRRIVQGVVLSSRTIRVTT